MIYYSCNNYTTEIPVMEVEMKLLRELESLGFPGARAVWALHHSGEVTLVYKLWCIFNICFQKMCFTFCDNLFSFSR